MNFRFARPTWARMDGLESDTLLVSHFDDERPLRGVGGLLDWRLNGKLSNLVLQGMTTGVWGEQLLYPQGERVPFNNLIYFGLGDRTKYNSTRFKEISNRMLRTVMRLQIWSFAMTLPGRDAVKLVPRQAIELWLSELQRVFVSQRYHDLQFDITFLCSEADEAEIKEPLMLFARQHGGHSESEWTRR